MSWRLNILYIIMFNIRMFFLQLCFPCYNLNVFYSEKYWKGLDSRTSLYISSPIMCEGWHFEHLHDHIISLRLAH